MDSLIIARELSSAAQPGARDFPVSLCSTARTRKLSPTEEAQPTRLMEVGASITHHPGNRAIKDTQVDWESIRMDPKSTKAECISDRPENRESTDAPRGRKLSRRRATPRESAGVSADLGIRELDTRREIGGSVARGARQKTRDSSPSVRKIGTAMTTREIGNSVVGGPSPKTRGAPPPVRKSGRRRRAGRSATHS